MSTAQTTLPTIPTTTPVAPPAPEKKKGAGRPSKDAAELERVKAELDALKAKIAATPAVVEKPKPQVAPLDHGKAIRSVLDMVAETSGDKALSVVALHHSEPLGRCVKDLCTAFGWDLQSDPRVPAIINTCVVVYTCRSTYAQASAEFAKMDAEEKAAKAREKDKAARAASRIEPNDGEGGAPPAAPAAPSEPAAQNEGDDDDDPTGLGNLQ